MSLHEVKLITSKDWDLWLTVIKGKATGYYVWELINPALATKPTGLEKPPKPAKPAVTADEAINTRALTAYKLDLASWKPELQEWKEQHTSFTKINDFIFSTVSKANLVYLEDVDCHPWNYLRALKTKLAPSDSARSLAVEKEYHKIITGPGSRQNVEAWLDEYTHVLIKAKNSNIPEALDEKRAYREFVHAIEKQAPMLAQLCEFNLDNLT